MSEWETYLSWRPAVVGPPEDVQWAACVSDCLITLVDVNVRQFYVYGANPSVWEIKYK